MVFDKEIPLVQNEKMSEFAKYYFSEFVPNYFWEIGASSSGKYHPTFSQGKGGLVRHTKAVVMVLRSIYESMCKHGSGWSYRRPSSLCS